uniref:Uncharacterized protein n=1 Tax=Anguilla anguilla TaxID=7936 RepID=A0A0E9S639_ANGAN
MITACTEIYNHVLKKNCNHFNILRNSK